MAKHADEYERIVARVVKGQVTDFVKAHPSIAKGVDWYKPRDDKMTTLINSITKRVVRDLCSRHTRERVKAAMLAGTDMAVDASGTATGGPLSGTSLLGTRGKHFDKW